MKVEICKSSTWTRTEIQLHAPWKLYQLHTYKRLHTKVPGISGTSRVVNGASCSLGTLRRSWLSHPNRMTAKVLTSVMLG